jgi:hypothetical protein
MSKKKRTVEETEALVRRLRWRASRVMTGFTYRKNMKRLRSAKNPVHAWQKAIAFAMKGGGR